MDRRLLIWAVISFLVCFINPYGARGFTLPIELLSRFDPENIFNQHIQEFMPFFSQPFFVVRDYLFLALLGLIVVIMVLTWRRRKAHEYLLLLAFLFLAINSIRNIPLFILIAFPILSRSLKELDNRLALTWNKARLAFYLILILLPIALTLRFLTNAWYISNNSFNQTGMGVNPSHQPVEASSFLVKNHLDGRILNSIGYGGWLSWTIVQPVFIDGRLEVMQESLYREITKSWNGHLSLLIDQYKPVLIFYNYLKYYPWTFQLKEMPGWRLIYIDGAVAIFANQGYAPLLRTISLSELPSQEMLIKPPPFISWTEGFYKPADQKSIDDMHKALFRIQMNTGSTGKQSTENAVTCFNLANERYRAGDIRGAISGYDSAILLQPGYAKAFNNRGVILAFEIKNYAGAKEDFDQAIHLDPQYGDAWLGRGTVLYFMHDTSGACRDWQRARQLGNLQAARLLGLHCNRK